MQKPYHRGFLLSSVALDTAPPHFVELKLPKAAFYHSQALPAALVQGSDRWLLFAGRAIDTRNGKDSGVAEKLLEALALGEECFFDSLENLSGRFLVVYQLDNRIRVLHDAGGLRAVFYVKGAPLLGSHASLVAQITGAGASDVQHFRDRNRIGFRFGHPGATTPYRDVFILPPNMLLDFPENRLKRYFPREPLEPISMDEAAKIVLDGMRSQLPAIHAPLVSLTAGIDSRLSLAAARRHDAEFFTYCKPGDPATNRDVAVGREIARRYQLNHRVIDVVIKPEDRDEFSRFERLAKRNTFYSHFRRLTFIYSKLFDSSRLHVRSNLSEIGRAFYRARRPKLQPLSEAKQAIRVYNPKLLGAAPVEDAFATFLKDADYSALFNYDSYDMFYWEHRMGCWHSHVVLESDFAFDTHVLFNSRKILKAMLAVPLRDRIRATLFNDIIHRELPELDDIPINPKNWPNRGR